MQPILQVAFQAIALRSILLMVLPNREEHVKPVPYFVLSVIRPGLAHVMKVNVSLGTKNLWEVQIVPPVSVAAQPAALQISLFAPAALPDSLDRLESALLVIPTVLLARELLPHA